MKLVFYGRHVTLTYVLNFGHDNVAEEILSLASSLQDVEQRLCRLILHTHNKRVTTLLYTVEPVLTAT